MNIFKTKNIQVKQLIDTPNGIIIKNHYIEPDALLKTKAYQENNDINKKFIDEFLVQKKGSGINWIELYTLYEEWYIREIDNKVPNKKIVKKYFEEKVFKKQIQSIPNIGKGWCGWNFKNDLKYFVTIF